MYDRKSKVKGRSISQSNAVIRSKQNDQRKGEDSGLGLGLKNETK